MMVRGVLFRRIGPALGALLVQIGCSSSSPPAESAPSPSAECPEGQKFDGQFCRVDGELAQSESLPEPAEDTDTTEEAAPQENEGEGDSGGSSDEGDPEAESAQPAEPPSELHATPVDVSMAAQAGPVITYLAGSHLSAGAKPLGAPFAAQFAEGQIFEQKVQLSVDRCYTVVAAGLPPIRDVEIAFFEEGAEEPSIRDEAVGPQAVVGSQKDCFKPPQANMKLVVTAIKGQGVIAGQVFEK